MKNFSPYSVKIRSALILLLMGAFSGLPARGSEAIKELDDYIQMKMERDHIPGLAICLVKPEGIVWSNGYGLAVTDRKAPMTIRSVFNIASISKLVTATAVLQLHEKKKIDIHDPVNRYLPFEIRHPAFPDAEITIAQLLNHTASTSNGPSLWRLYACGENRVSLRNWAEFYFTPGAAYYHSDGNFAGFKPGEGFQYSNAGYGLLSFLVEVVSGESFNEYCRKNIFEPLEMKNTSFEVRDIPRDLSAVMYSWGYGWELERDLFRPDTDYEKVIQSDYLFPLCHYTCPTFGAAALYTSAEELSKFMIMLMNRGVYRNRRILRKENVDGMFAPSVNPSFLPGQFAEFGLGGYAMRLSNGEPVRGHSGADPGTSTFMLFNPEIRMGVIVMANRFVDIREMIEWAFAEGFGAFCEGAMDRVGGNWRAYSRKAVQRTVEIQVDTPYLPGGSQLFIIGNQRQLGQWVRMGIPLEPRKDGRWSKTFRFADSTRLAFKITRGSWATEAVEPDGKPSPDRVFTVEKDSVLNIRIHDWKDTYSDM